MIRYLCVHSLLSFDVTQAKLKVIRVLQPGTQSAIRLFNLSPDTKQASMALGGKSIAGAVAYSLGSKWVEVAAKSETFTFTDAQTGKRLSQKTETPPKAPIGATNFLLGLQSGGNDFGITVVPLNDGAASSIDALTDVI